MSISWKEIQKSRNREGSQRNRKWPLLADLPVKRLCRELQGRGTVGECADHETLSTRKSWPPSRRLSESGHTPAGSPSAANTHKSRAAIISNVIISSYQPEKYGLWSPRILVPDAIEPNRTEQPTTNTTDGWPRPQGCKRQWAGGGGN